MTAGDIGVVLSINVSGLGYSIPGGSVCSMLVVPQGSSQALTLVPVSVSADGTTGTYLTTGTDITSGGTWSAQLQVSEPGGNRYTSPAGTFLVNPRLGGT